MTLAHARKSRFVSKARQFSIARYLFSQPDRLMTPSTTCQHARQKKFWRVARALQHAADDPQLAFRSPRTSSSSGAGMEGVVWSTGLQLEESEMQNGND